MCGKTEVTNLDGCMVKVFGSTQNILQFNVTVNKAKHMAMSYSIKKLGHHFLCLAFGAERAIFNLFIK